MEYHSNFIWEKGNEECMRISLVLQHVQIRKKSVLLACVCESGNEGEAGITESGYFSEGLVEWFHRSFLKQCERKLTDEEVEKLLRVEVQRIFGDIERFVAKKGLREQLHFWSILLWDNRFWIFSKGDCEGYLVNRRFQKKHLRRLGTPEQRRQHEDVKQSKGAGLHRKAEGSDREQWLSGRLQRNLGILLCTAGFLENMEPEMAAEVLCLDGEITEGRLEKRLQELRQENIQRGGRKTAGAVYLHT